MDFASPPGFISQAASADFGKIIEDGQALVSILATERTIENIRLTMLFLRVLVTFALVGYGIWFSVKLKSIIYGDHVDKDAKSAEVDRHIYMHRLWVGDSKGIITMVVDIWQWYLITLVGMLLLKRLLKRYVKSQ